MKTSCLLVLISFFIYTIGKADDPGVDKKALAENYYDIAIKYVNTNPDSTIYYGKKQQLIAEELEDDNLLAKAYFILGYAYSNKKKFDVAAQYYYDGLNEIKYKTGRLIDIRRKEIYNGLGFINEQIYNYDLALKYYSESLMIAKKLGHSSMQIALLTYYVGIIHKKKFNFERAKTYYLNALNRFKSMNKKHYLAKTYNSLGNVHLYLQDYDSSRIYYKKALEISEKVNSLERERIYYINNLGEIAFRRDQYDTAKSLYLQALQECESLQDTSKMSWLLNNIGDVFLAVQNYHEAIDYYKRSLEVEKGQNISSEYERAIKNISAAYDSLGNFKTASEYKNKYVQHLEKTSNTKEKLIHRNSQYLEAQSKWAIKEYMLLTLCCLFLIVLSCIVIGIVHHRKQTNS